MKAELYTIWEVEELVEFPWRAQLVNYVGQFETREKAERYVAAIKKERERGTGGHLVAQNFRPERRSSEFREKGMPAKKVQT